MLILSSRTIDAIRRNYEFGALGGAALIELMTNRVAPGAERGARALARILEDRRFSVQDAHEEGSRDAVNHYTVWVHHHGHRGYHLRLDSRGIIFQVTGPDGRDLGQVSPWVAPGSTPRS